MATDTETETDFASHVAHRVAAELATSGRRQRDLAAHLGISQGTMSRRLSGAFAFPVRELPSIAAFFGITVDALLAEQAA